MIKKCQESDASAICEIVNDAAKAYKGVIPEDRWKEPYMPLEELKHEIDEGVIFWGFEEQGLQGVMGIQQVEDVTLIRHAYVKSVKRNTGIGTRLLKHLEEKIDGPILIGTWKDAVWAIKFYEKNGYSLVAEEEKNILLKKYWSIPQRQVETSVVLQKNFKNS